MPGDACFLRYTMPMTLAVDITTPEEYEAVLAILPLRDIVEDNIT